MNVFFFVHPNAMLPQQVPSSTPQQSAILQVIAQQNYPKGNLTNPALHTASQSTI